MAIDFPSSPALNDKYSFGGRTWIWNGVGWVFSNIEIANQVEAIYTATAGQVSFSLPEAAPNASAVLVAVDGVIQSTSNYTLANDGLSITLAEAPGQNATVRLLLLGYTTGNTLVPADDTVTTIKLRDGSVTGSKIGNTYIVTETAISKTLVNRESCTVTTGGLTITLPATPSPGWEIAITTDGAFMNTVVARNGEKIMELDEDLIFDALNATIELFYVDATRGWRIV
jgi:hypothetical protein